MKHTSYQKLQSNLQPGQTYRREELASYSKALDRDLATLVEKGVLEKVAAGTYYFPKTTRFGVLPPSNVDLVKTFLKDDHFLLVTLNQYNNLGLGLTQLYNKVLVYNRKRHGVFELAGKKFDFRRPSRGFPNKLSLEFLLVDLVNNLNELAEDTNRVKEQLKLNFANFNNEKFKDYLKTYGKNSTQQFFKELIT
jgi:hypothetical protein